MTRRSKFVALSLEVVALEFLVGDSESAKTTSGVLLDILLELVAAAQFDDDSGHTLGDALELARGLLAVGDLGTLIDRLEGFEVQEFGSGTGRRRITESSDNRSVDGVLGLYASRRQREGCRPPRRSGRRSGWY